MVTGDMFTSTDINTNTDETNLVAYKLLKSLSKNHKIIYVSGNHEENVNNSFYIRYLKELKNIGVVFINNDKYNLYKSSGSINVYGITYYSSQNNDYLSKIKLDKSKLNILLSHDPIEFPTFASYGFDLTLSGHIHGGIIRLPIVGGLLDPNRKLFPKYDKGIYREGNSHMNVSSGLGNAQIHRVFNPPKLNVIVLKQK